MKIYWHQTRSRICLFVYSHTSNFQLSCGCHHCWWQGCKFWPMLGTQGLWAGWDLYCATPTATRNLGLIRKTGTHSGIRTPDARIKALILYLITIWNCMYMHIYTFYYTIRHCHFRMWCKDWCDSLQSTEQYCWHIWYRTIHPERHSVLWFRMWTPIDILTL